MAKTPEVVTPEIVPGSPADRTRAYRIRNALKRDPDAVPQDDIDWLEAYKATQAANKGASRTHKVSYSEESAEAVGTGTAAEVAAAMAAPQLAKEEGRRIDSLILAATQATTMANKATQAAYEMVLRMGQQLLERNGQLENVHLGMLEAIRKGHLDLTAAEAELMRKEAEHDAEEKDGITGMVRELLPALLGEMAKRGVGVKPK